MTASCSPQTVLPKAPAADAAIFEATHCTQILTTDLTDEERSCPLCSETYSDLATEPTTNAPSDPNAIDAEHPIRVDFDNCHHIFGHLCLRKLIFLDQAWSKRCPLCRAHWFKKDLDSLYAQHVPQLALPNDWDMDDDDWVLSDQHLSRSDTHLLLERGSSAIPPEGGAIASEFSRTIERLPRMHHNLDRFESGIGPALPPPSLHNVSLHDGTWEINLRRQNSPVIHANDERIPILQAVLSTTHERETGLRGHIARVIETWSNGELTAIWERSSGVPVGRKFRIVRNHRSQRYNRTILNVIREYIRGRRQNVEDGGNADTQLVAEEDQGPGGVRWERWVGIKLTYSEPPGTTMAWVNGDLCLIRDLGAYLGRQW